MLRKILKLFSNLLWTQKNWEEDYLAQSTDHADLERRIRKLGRSHIMVTNTDNTYTQRKI